MQYLEVVVEGGEAVLPELREVRVPRFEASLSDSSNRFMRLSFRTLPSSLLRTLSNSLRWLRNSLILSISSGVRPRDNSFLLLAYVKLHILYVFAMWQSYAFAKCLNKKWIWIKCLQPSVKQFPLWLLYPWLCAPWSWDGRFGGSGGRNTQGVRYTVTS